MTAGELIAVALGLRLVPYLGDFFRNRTAGSWTGSGLRPDRDTRRRRSCGNLRPVAFGLLQAGLFVEG